MVLREDNQPTKHNAFPVFKKREGFEKLKKQRTKSNNRLYGIEDRAVWQSIEEEQPYKLKDPRTSLLAVVSELSNVDKHRILLENIYLSTKEQITAVYEWNPHARLLEHRVEDNPKRLYEHQTEIASLRFCKTGPDPRLHVKSPLTVTPMFGGGATRDDPAIHASLGSIRDTPIYVGGVVDKFQKFF